MLVIAAISLLVDNMYEDEHRPTSVQQPAHMTDHVVCNCHATKSGVYKTPADRRVIDVVSAAGGLRLGADIESINLAEQVRDCMQIVVYEQKQPPSLSR